MDKTVDELNREVQDIWNRNAEFWDGKVGDGNLFQNHLIGPVSERLLELRPGQEVLEIACGNGVFSRRMAELGARVLATDFSDNFLEKARAHKTPYDDRLEYRNADAANEAELLALGEGRFDAVVCNMAIMDMATTEPLASATRKLLKPGGRFVFSITHPVFNHPGAVRLAEETDQGGVMRTKYSIKVERYASSQTELGIGIQGQPAATRYFNRSMSVLFSTFFRAGLVLDALEEPLFDPDLTPTRPMSWEHFKEIPPALVVRMRPAPSGWE